MTRRPVPGERTIEHPKPQISERLLRLHPYVRQTGDDFRKPWLLRSRKLLDYLVVYIAEGAGRFVVAGEEFPVGPGDLIWIPPDTLHEMEGYAPVMHCVYAHFDLLYDPARSHWDACIPGAVQDLTLWSSLMHPSLNDPLIDSWHGKLPVTNGPAIGALLSSICVEHRRAPAGNALQLAGMVLQLVGLIAQGMAPAGHPTPHHRTLEGALGFVHEHPDRPLDVGRLAGAVGLSASHFRKLFREHTGRSPRSMHRQARMRKACELLVYNPAMNISQVAFALGFSTVHNFSRAFRDVTGYSPRAYRRVSG